MNTTPFAVAHFDGEVDFESLEAGIMQAPKEVPGIRMPIVFFRVLAGGQSHPVWAMEKLAAKVQSYYLAAKENDEHHIEINLTANLITDTRTDYPFATKVIWHSSSRVRGQAEFLVYQLTGNGKDRLHSYGCAWIDRWPFQKPLKVPVAAKLLMEEKEKEEKK